MKKYLIAVMAMACLALVLAACSGNRSGGSDEDQDAELELPEDAVVVTDVDFGDSQVHEELEPLDFDPDESVDSAFYKRTTDPADGSAAYLVKRSSDGEEVYLPMSKTVCYVDETLGDRAYYERVPLSYIADGEPVETYQYQIFTSAYVVGG